jgi:hypothetical protein
VKCFDGSVELVKGCAERPGQLIALGQKGVPLRPEDAQIEFAVLLLGATTSFTLSAPAVLIASTASIRRVLAIS